MIYFDTETCGLHGPIVLIQYAVDDGDVVIYEVWKEPIKKTMALIERFCNEGVIGFNLAFDWFHLCQLYTNLNLIDDKDASLIDKLDDYIANERAAVFGPCLKPKHAFDLMLHARKGPYQSTMDRKPIIIKRIPTPLAEPLRDELQKRIPLPDIYFAKKKEPVQWQIEEIEGRPEFRNIVLRFSPSSALKVLVKDALGITTVSFESVDLPKNISPIEYGYAPYSSGEYWSWPDVIKFHIAFWEGNSDARKYAKNDVIYLQKLYDYFGKPEVDDYDSILACMVGAVRWKGFPVNIDKLKALRAKKIELIRNRFNSPKNCLQYLKEVMTASESQSLTINGLESSKSILLEQIAKWQEESVCDDCNGEGCGNCVDGLIKTGIKHPAAKRATEILTSRRAKKEVELFDKLIFARRFHPSFVVVGTLSSRMAGGDGFNAQGVKRAEDIRSCFYMHDSDNVLCGGDFDGFEVTIADAVYQDPDLRKDLESGKKIHGLFGEFLFPGMSYDEILATKDKEGDADKYLRSKNGVFALLYGGEAYTLSNRVGIPEAVAEKAYQRWIKKYKKWGEARKRIIDKFCSMNQPGGIGTKVEWHEPSEYVESLLGFRRYFTLENKITKTLFNLAEKPPKEWSQIKIKVVRRDREQSACGAVRSALFGAAFAIQASCMRAAANHEIQSTGAEITKLLQRNIWDLQPHGVNEWIVQPVNVHDEVMSAVHPDHTDSVKATVEGFISKMKSVVPRIGMKWKSNLTSWAGK